MNRLTNTQDKYHEIKQKLLLLAEKHAEIKAVVAIGSSTRSDVPADEYSDLDLIIATDDTDAWLYGNLPAELGDVKVSFVEPTLGGGTFEAKNQCGNPQGGFFRKRIQEPCEQLLLSHGMGGKKTSARRALVG